MRSWIRRTALALLVAAPSAAGAVQISANAANVNESSASPLEPVVTASYDGLRGTRLVSAAAISNLVSATVESGIRVESPAALSDCCSSTGVTAGNVLDDDILIDGGTPDVDFGTLTLTVTMVGILDASDVPGPPADSAWGRFGATLLTRLNDSSQARGELLFDAEGANAFETDLGTTIDVTTTPNSSGGTIEMVLVVTPGDVVDFRMTGNAAAWSGRKEGSYGLGELTFASLDVALDGGLTWTSESGVLLTPEPDGATVTALGALAVLMYRAGRRS